MKVGDLVVCTQHLAGQYPLHVGGVYRLSSVHVRNSRAGPRQEVCLVADDSGAPTGSRPAGWFRALLGCWHVNLDAWCLSCGRWEFDGPSDFIACLECGHVYRTAADLVEAENDIRRQMGDAELDPLGDALAQIFSCPLCTHDW